MKALRPGGVFLLEAYHPNQIELKTGGPPDPRVMMTAEGLRKELADLEFEILREVQREIHEGPFHNGESAVVQVLAKKHAGRIGPKGRARPACAGGGGAIVSENWHSSAQELEAVRLTVL